MKEAKAVLIDMLGEDEEHILFDMDEVSPYAFWVNAVRLNGDTWSHAKIKYGETEPYSCVITQSGHMLAVVDGDFDSKGNTTSQLIRKIRRINDMPLESKTAYNKAPKRMPFEMKKVCDSCGEVEGAEHNEYCFYMQEPALGKPTYALSANTVSYTSLTTVFRIAPLSLVDTVELVHFLNNEISGFELGDVVNGQVSSVKLVYSDDLNKLKLMAEKTDQLHIEGLVAKWAAIRYEQSKAA